MFSHVWSKLAVLTWSKSARSHMVESVTLSREQSCHVLAWLAMSLFHMVEVVKFSHGQNCLARAWSKLSHFHVVKVVTFSHGRSCHVLAWPGCHLLAASVSSPSRSVSTLLGPDSAFGVTFRCPKCHTQPCMSQTCAEPCKICSSSFSAVVNTCSSSLQLQLLSGSEMGQVPRVPGLPVIYIVHKPTDVQLRPFSGTEDKKEDKCHMLRYCWCLDVASQRPRLLIRASGDCRVSMYCQ